MELTVKQTGKTRILDEGDVKEKHTMTMVGASRDGKLNVKVTFTADSPATIASQVPMIEGTKRDIVFKKVNQTLDEFKADGAIPKGAVDMTDADQEAYEARLKAALDIDKPITLYTSV